MKVVKIQVALFLKEFLNRPDLLAERINQGLGNLFDAMPTCLDLPLDAPAEIPVVTRKSTKLPHTLNIARKRCDLILTPSIENENLSVIESRYSDEISEFIKATSQSAEIVRVGVVYTVFQKNAEPCNYISEKYFGGTLKGENELSFRVNKVTNIKGLSINNVFNVSNAVAEVNGQEESGVLLVRDTNNVRDSENKPLTEKQINSIMKHSYMLLNEEIFGEAK